MEVYIEEAGVSALEADPLAVPIVELLDDWEGPGCESFMEENDDEL